MVVDSHFSTILFGTQEECTIIIIILVRMEAFYSSTCISILFVFEFLISSFNVFTDYVKKIKGFIIIITIIVIFIIIIIGIIIIVILIIIIISVIIQGVFF